MKEIVVYEMEPHEVTEPGMYVVTRGTRFKERKVAEVTQTRYGYSLPYLIVDGCPMSSWETYVGPLGWLLGV